MKKLIIYKIINIFKENNRTYCSQKRIIYSVTVSWYVFPLFENINSNISFCKIKIIFKSSTWLANFFSFKDKIPLCLRFNIIYKFTYGRCNATYYGEMCCHLKVRVGEHSGISPLTNTQPLKTICWFVTNQFLLMTWKCLLLVILKSIWKS